jgi:hypothetical protein
MTKMQLENLVLRGVVVRFSGESVELCRGITGEMADRTGVNPPTYHPTLNPWTSATRPAGGTSASLRDAWLEADASGHDGAGRPRVEGRAFGSRPQGASRPSADGQPDFRQQPAKSVRLALGAKGNPDIATRTDHRRTGNTSVGG